MAVIAIANGILRDMGYARYMSELRAHQVSTLTGCVLFGFYIKGVIVTWPPASAEAAMAIGLIWFIMTVLFEFGVGHFGAGHSWKRLFQDYNLRECRVWPVILIWVSIAPYLFYRCG